MLSGSLNRGDLAGLRYGTLQVAKGTAFDRADHGLIIDDESEYEDCAYLADVAGETSKGRVKRIEGMVRAMEAAYGDYLAGSYDPKEQDRGVTAIRSEWELFSKELQESGAVTRSAAPSASLSSTAASATDPKDAYGAKAERRMAPGGKRYTEAEFLDFFGGLREWKAAGIQSSAQGPAATATKESRAYVWEFEDGRWGSGKWWKYDDAAQALLNQAHTAGQELLTLGRYSVNLETMVQTNTVTGWHRMVRCT